MPFEIKEPPKEKKCLHCQTPMIFKSLGDPYYLWRCPCCNYRETFAPLSTDPKSVGKMFMGV